MIRSSRNTCKFYYLKSRDRFIENCASFSTSKIVQVLKGRILVMIITTMAFHMMSRKAILQYMLAKIGPNTSSLFLSWNTRIPELVTTSWRRVWLHPWDGPHHSLWWRSFLLSIFHDQIIKGADEARWSFLPYVEVD